MMIRARAYENDRQPSTYVCLFLYSPSIAPPMISTAPMICIGSIVSFKKITENNTADSGSRYPHIATVCTGSFPMDEK